MITDPVTGQRIYQVSELNARGQVTSALMSGNLRQTEAYDSYGLPQSSLVQRMSRMPTTIANLGYNFNAQRGLLSSRSNSIFGWSESFTYDSQDRLTDFNDNNGNNSHAYDSRGRITYNSQLGDYSYAAESYRQTELTNLTTAADTWYQERHLQQISYNAFKSPIEIDETGKEKILFRYNGALQRSHMFYGDTIGVEANKRYARHYSEDGSMEITSDRQAGTTSFVFYLGGDAYSAPAIWKEVHTTAQTTQDLYFLYRDYLGSIVLITDEGGYAVEQRAFDAWGNLVKLEDGNGNPLAAFVILDRGYTGHEHLLGVGLIHMNGRLYDPKLHRFLSPDNYVQDPYNTQNFNRYGYVLNNPLSHVDPSGEFWHIIIGAFIGVVTNGINNIIHDKGFFEGAGKAALIGGIGGAFSMGIGTAAQGMSGVGKAAFQTLAHGHLGGVMSGMSGGTYGQGFLSGAIGSGIASGAGALLKNAGGFIQAAGMTSAAAVSGGIGAEIAGGNFWDGFRNGAISGGLNHAAHAIQTGIQQHRE